MRTARSQPDAAPQVSLRAKLFALLGGPLAWTAHLGAGYLVVAIACSTGWGGARAVITLLTAVLAPVALFAGWFAADRWRRVQRAPSWEHALNEAGGHEGLLLLVGVMSAGLFAFLIVLNGVTPFLVPECAP